MSKEINSNLLISKELAITALGQFIHVLLSEPLKDMGSNIDRVIQTHVSKLKFKEGKVDLTKIDFNTLAIEVKKEVIKTFEKMETEFKSTEEPKA